MGEATDSSAKSPAKRSDSKLGSFAGGVSLESLIGERVKLPRTDVGFELTIPCFGIELREPFAKLRQLLRGKLLDLTFEILDFSHDGTQNGKKYIVV